jgi:hypothetical protein
MVFIHTVKFSIQYINLEHLSTFQRSLESSLNTLRRSLVISLVGYHRRTAQFPLVHINGILFRCESISESNTFRDTGGKAFIGCFS